VLEDATNREKYLQKLKASADADGGVEAQRKINSMKVSW
jgi:hypothetical protein